MREDVRIIEIFLRGLNRETGTSYEIREFPDAEDRNRPAVDAIAEDRDRGKLAIEHTLLEPYEGQIADQKGFEAVFGRLMRAPAFRVPGRFIVVDVPALSIPKRYGWDKGQAQSSVGEAVCEWFIRARGDLPDGRSEQSLPGLGFDLRVQVYSADFSQRAFGRKGVLWVRRMISPGSHVAVVRKALQKKLPKLAKTDVRRRILLLEFSVPTIAFREVSDAIGLLRPQFPNVTQVESIWAAVTAARQTDGQVFYECILPYGGWPSFISPDD